MNPTLVIIPLTRMDLQVTLRVAMVLHLPRHRASITIAMKGDRYPPMTGMDSRTHPPAVDQGLLLVALHLGLVMISTDFRRIGMYNILTSPSRLTNQRHLVTILLHSNIVEDRYRLPYLVMLPSIRPAQVVQKYQHIDIDVAL
jgi:hypothetical protein